MRLTWTATIVLSAAALLSACARSPENNTPAQCLRLQDAIGLKPSLEQAWSSTWELREARIEEVDHGQEGFLLVWARQEDDSERTRKDAIISDWMTGECRIYWAHEGLWRNGVLLERGYVVLTSSGQPVLRTMVSVGEEERSRFSASRVYALEILDGASAMCRYEASAGFVASRHLGGLWSVPYDARFVSGNSDCPSIEELQLNPFRELFPPIETDNANEG